ncbi:MAG: HD domain-containing protein [Candidatus Nanoarchaeia archaeon]
MDQKEKLYDYIHPKFKPYSSLVQRLNTTCCVFSPIELAEFFEETEIKSIIKVNELYAQTPYKRSCGNPLFAHPLRVAIWLHAIGCDEKLVRIAVYHDVLEDLPKSYHEMGVLFDSLPQDIALEINAMTNQTSFFTKIARKQNIKKEEMITRLQEISHPAMQEAAQEAVNFLQNADIKELYKESYEMYLAKIVEFAQSRNSEDIILVKLADRIDNTLADMPGKFNNIMKLYAKNELLLRYFKPFLENNPSKQLQVLYAILVERCFRQLQFIENNYKKIMQKRGEFYAQQYSGLYSKILSTKSKFDTYKEVLNTLCKKDVKNILSNIQESEYKKTAYAHQ